MPVEGSPRNTISKRFQGSKLVLTKFQNGSVNRVHNKSPSSMKPGPEHREW